MPETAAASAAPVPVRVWDLPTRLFHWLLAALVLVSLSTAWVGGNLMQWHMRSGIMIMALLLFRVAWGFVGGRWSRFASFTYAPATLLRYLRGQMRPDEQAEVGHNPLGSLSVYGMLLVFTAQVGTGLVADDDIATVGPLNGYVGKAQGLAATSWHHGPGQWLVVGLVLLHIAAIVYYRVRKKVDLVQPMLCGDKALDPPTPASADGWPTRLLAAALALGCLAVAGWVARQGG